MDLISPLDSKSASFSGLWKIFEKTEAGAIVNWESGITPFFRQFS